MGDPPQGGCLKRPHYFLPASLPSEYLSTPPPSLPGLTPTHPEIHPSLSVNKTPPTWVQTRMGVGVHFWWNGGGRLLPITPPPPVWAGGSGALEGRHALSSGHPECEHEDTGDIRGTSVGRTWGGVGTVTCCVTLGKSLHSLCTAVAGTQPSPRRTHPASCRAQRTEGPLETHCAGPGAGAHRERPKTWFLPSGVLRSVAPDESRRDIHATFPREMSRGDWLTSDLCPWALPALELCRPGRLLRAAGAAKWGWGCVWGGGGGGVMTGTLDPARMRDFRVLG